MEWGREWWAAPGGQLVHWHMGWVGALLLSAQRACWLCTLAFGALVALVARQLLLFVVEGGASHPFVAYFVVHGYREFCAGLFNAQH